MPLPDDHPPKARETVFDTEAQTLGVTYAKALLGAAEKAGQTETVVEEIDSLIREVFDRYPKFEQILASRVIPHEEKLGIIDRALAGQASELFTNFLKVLARHERLDLLRPVRRACHDLYQRMRGRVAVHVRTATELDDAMASLIAKSLKSVTGGQPVLERTTDPDLIGGAVIQIGDTVYDGSVRMQLLRARANMIDRSVHAIQSRRDRFGSPE